MLYSDIVFQYPAACGGVLLFLLLTNNLKDRKNQLIINPKPYITGAIAAIWFGFLVVLGTRDKDDSNGKSEDQAEVSQQKSSATTSDGGSSPTGDNQSVNADTATIKYDVDISLTPKLIGFNVAKQVYEEATKHPNLKKIRVELVLDASNADLVDNYGHPIVGKLTMGWLVIDDLDEVRRYEQDANYTYHEEDILAEQISQMALAHLLAK